MRTIYNNEYLQVGACFLLPNKEITCITGIEPVPNDDRLRSIESFGIHRTGGIMWRERRFDKFDLNVLAKWGSFCCNGPALAEYIGSLKLAQLNIYGHDRTNITEPPYIEYLHIRKLYYNFNHQLDFIKAMRLLAVGFDQLEIKL